MYKSIITFCTLLVYVVIVSCNNNKPQPLSKDITKSAIIINGKKDSVINNPQKKYGNATVAEPCVKCLIQAIQRTANYKASVASSAASGVNYIVNWEQGAPPADRTGKHSTTNALRLDVTKSDHPGDTIASFIYNNAVSKLFFVNNGNNVELSINEADLMLIRNKCFWGVTSSK